MTAPADNDIPAASAARTRNYVLGILTFVYAFNFIDRQILIILQESIKADLGLSDTQLGLLSGTWFAVFYATAGIPIARWADHANRRNIIALSLALWSAMTALSGLAQSYTHLIAARIGLGIGQAGCSPPAHSIISDYFPFSQRATALSVYSVGIFIGVAFALLAGGWINEFFGWRAAFVIVGLPGILMAVVVRLTVKEPKRGLSDGVAYDDTPPPPFWPSMAQFWHQPAFRYIMLGSALCAFVNTGGGYWVPSFLMREHGMSSGEVGTVLALIAGLGGAASVFLAGYLSDRLGGRDPRWYLWIPALGALISVPLRIAGLAADDLSLTLAAFAAAQLFDAFFLAPSIAACHGLVTPRLRALVSSVLFFTLTIIGVGLGPLMVGAVSELYAAQTGDPGLGPALIMLSMFGLLAAAIFFAGTRAFSTALAEQRAKSGGAVITGSE